MRRAPLATIVLLAALSACGGDKAGSRGTLTVEAGRPVPVEGFEYGFEPGTITVRAGGREADVRFELTNGGTLPHDLHVREGDEELGGTEAIGDGDKASATVKLAPGDYEFYCSIGDHADLGMKGALTIE
jgi:plastocyanin